MTFFDLLFGTHTWKTSEEVVVTDVTRMQGDKACIAALDRRGYIRLHDPSPNDEWLRSIGGLTPGDIVSLTWKQPRRYARPHVEDADWNPSAPAFRKIGRLPEDDLVARLSADAFDSVEKAFGKPCFHSDKGNAAFPPGRGSRSLATLVAKSVRTYPYGDGVRVDFSDSKTEWPMVPMEDLTVRNHQRQCKSCSRNLANWLLSEFRGTRAVLRIGLGRPFQAAGQPLACWLQVNHIFLMPSKRNHFV